MSAAAWIFTGKALFSFVTLAATVLTALHALKMFDKRTSKTPDMRKQTRRVIWLGAAALVLNVLVPTGEFVEKCDAENKRLVAETNAAAFQDRLMSEIKRVTEANYERYKPGLDKRYDKGYVIFSIAGMQISEQISAMPAGTFRADWNTAKLIELNESHVKFKIPDFRLRGWHIEGSVVGLARRDGATNRPVGLGAAVVIEVLRDHPMGVTMVFGLQSLVPPQQR